MSERGILLRTAFSYDPPIMLLEYRDVDTKKIRHRKIPLDRALQNVDAKKLPKLLLALHGDIIPAKHLENYLTLIQRNTTIGYSINSPNGGLMPPKNIESNVSKYIQDDINSQCKNVGIETPKSTEPPPQLDDRPPPSSLLPELLNITVDKALKSYTMEEVEEHCQDKSCWIIVQDLVLDVTTWLRKHPGGAARILRYGGGDCTSDFMTTHGKTPKALEMISKLCIGKLVKEIKQSPSPSGGKIKNVGANLPETLSKKYSRPLPTTPLAKVAETVISTLRAKWNSMNKVGPVAFTWTSEELELLLPSLRALFEGVKEQFKKEPYPYLKLKSPICVLGDLHGNFDDLDFLADALHMESALDQPGDYYTEDFNNSKPVTLRIAEHAVLLQTKEICQEILLGSLPNAQTPLSKPWPPTGRRLSLGMQDQDPRKVDKSFLFLGDYVDRGLASLEVVSYVFALKAAQPNSIFVLRGNHETKEINAHYGFKDECIKAYGSQIGTELFNTVNEVFGYLPLAASIDGNIFCAHGGIPQTASNGEDDRLNLLTKGDWKEFLEVQSIDPKAEINTTSSALLRQTQLFYDLMWADPAPPQSSLNYRGFGESPRGAGCLYGQTAVNTFLRNHKFQLIVRAHEPKPIGFQIQKESKVVTVFSSGQYNEPDDVAGAIFVQDECIRAITRARPKAL